MEVGKRHSKAARMSEFNPRSILLILCLACAPVLRAQLPCIGTIGTTTQVAAGNWTAATVPSTMTGSVPTTTTAFSNTVTVSSAAGLAIGNTVSGTNIPPGTTITNIVGTTLTLSAAATGSGTNVLHSYTVPGWAANNPPANIVTPGNVATTTAACSVCPSLFTASICANNYATYYMCAGNVYTISLCNSGPLWNSTLSITTNTFASAAGQGFPLSDDDGCGTASGHATITYIPTTTGSFRIRVFSNAAGNPCTVNTLLCGTLQITCSPAPPPPTNDNPCGATPLPVGSSCNMQTTSTSWATNTTPPTTPTVCTATGYVGYDVWYTAVVPASGSLAVQTNLVGATNLAMAIYTATACNAALAGWTQQYCNVDIAPGVLQPFIAFNNPALAGQTVYIRVWPQGGAATGGAFEICAYEPVPPPNDNPCTATSVPVTAGCTTVPATNQDATPTAGVGAPSCGVTTTYNDVWFTVQVPAAPPGAGVIINTSGTALDDVAMAVYTAPSCAGAFTEVGCNDPAGMPSLQVNQNGGSIVAGTILYVRVWNKTPLFGTFSICATPTIPPSNNEPCGATPIPLQYGCLYSSFTNTNASTTPTTLAGQHLSAPAPSCGAPATNDVWFSVTAPNPIVAGQSLVFDTDDGSLSNAAMAVYRVASGACSGTLSLTQLACAQGGSANNANMPTLSILQNTLVAGETLYVRVWRESGTDGTFALCARRTDNPPGNCSYTLRLNDTANDGWNGSYVTVCVGAVCTNYTITGASGFITFPANIGQAVTIAYTPVGGFQNQISYQLTTPNGGLLFSSGTTPAAGFQYAFTVDGLCNVPPAPQEDCAGAVQICSNASISANPQNTGAVVDLTLTNRGCLIANERRGVWFRFQVSTAGQLGFTINAFPYGGADYDYGLWGPYASITCPPPGPPLRCSWGDGPVLTGLNWVATDFTEGAFGDSWTQYITTNVGEWYVLFVDNFYTQYWGTPFDFTFQGAPGCGVGPNPPCASVSCLLPVEFLDLTGEAVGTTVDLKWTTASETGTSHFVVERSANGSDFTAIGTVEAAGNSLTRTDYTFVDPAPRQGTNYYRLHQIDLGGSGMWSGTVAVQFRSLYLPVGVFPNPAKESLTVDLGGTQPEDMQWRMLDMSGRAIGAGFFPATMAKTTHSIPLTSVEPGSYVLEVLGPGGAVVGTARFVRE